MSKSYWNRRQIEDAYQYFESAEDVADQISKVYLKASRYLSLAADEVFEKYQTKHGLSEAEALRLINTLQDKASLDELLQQLKNNDSDKSKKELLAKLEAPAYQARLERFRQIQNQLNIIMQDVYNQEKAMNDSFYVDLARESYYKSIFRVQQKVNTAFGFDVVSAKVIDSVIHSRWSGKNYSERIWGNTKALAQDLKEELLINLITGRSNREAAEIIANKFAQGSSTARRLVRTESNYVCTEMNFKAYKECGIQEYRYLATLDLKTCTRCCRPLDGKKFNIKDKQIGVNCPPMHPWCRCTVTSVINEEYLKQMKRIARDPVTGKNMKVPATMTYEEWYKKYVEGKPEAKLEEKKLKNKRTDGKQYDEYKKVIGKYAGKTLDDFQNMKYNEPEKWEDIKAYKKYAIEYPGSDKKDYDVQKAIKEAGIKGIAKIKPEKMDVSEYTYDEKHINAEREHRVSRDEAERFIKESDISLTRWNGRFVNYYSKNGATYVDVENKNIRTAFTRKEFDKNTLKIREVAEKYATKKSRVSDSKKED